MLLFSGGDTPMQAPLDRTVADLAVVPAPVAVRVSRGTEFTLARSTRILTSPGSAEAERIGAYLAGLLRPSTGYPLPVTAATTGGTGEGDGIWLQITRNDQLSDEAREDPESDEGYELRVTGASVTLRASRPEGLFRGVQTLRQLLPASIERATAQAGPWRVPGGRIVDRPRFAWRGAALDVARHFFTVEEVKRYIDLISLYKLNVLHLHLTDDQGWRIAVDGWPNLSAHGGSTQVGGGRGGFYTKQEYWEIVGYARDRYITVVPEIDVPGHTNAARASCAELNRDGRAPELYTGTIVGFSSGARPSRFSSAQDASAALVWPGTSISGTTVMRTLRDDQYVAF